MRYFLLSGGHSLRQVNFTGRNSPAIDLEFGEVENGPPDTEIDNYWVSRSIANEYRDSDLVDDCEIAKTSATTNLARRTGATRGAAD